WLAGSQPEAADHALIGSVALADIRRAAVLTDGAARLVEPFHATDWNGLLDILNSNGPRELLRRVRHLEVGDPDGRRWPRYKPRDDATVAYLTTGDMTGKR
ncbi:MAG: integrase, partial [Solirubrobacteraceae bacterium]